MSFTTLEKEMQEANPNTKSSATDGTVWARFERERPDGNKLKFKIQNLPKGKEEEAADFMIEYFVKEEAWDRTCEIAKNEAAVEEVRKDFFTALTKYPTLVCLEETHVDTDEDQRPEIAACNILFPLYKKQIIHGQSENFVAEELKLRYKIIERADAIVTNGVFNKYEIDEFLYDYGMAVHKNYRGFGIATEILVARRPLCKQLGIGVTAAVFTGAASQRAAERAGYELVAELDYRSFGELCGLTFQADAPTWKCLALRVS